jgi:hypothetical protein
MGLELSMVGVIVEDMPRAAEFHVGHCARYDVRTALRFATVDDPDGNTVLLSASVPEA